MRTSQRSKVSPPIPYLYPLFLPSPLPGLEGIIEAYKTSLDKVKLLGPTNFAPSIKKACEVYRESVKSGSQCYTVLLILTDGEITDFQDTIEEIVEVG